MLLLSKMIMHENQTLTFDKVYSLFQREFPHVRYVRYVDVESNLMYPLRFLHFRGSRYLIVGLVGNNVISADKTKDNFYLSGNEIWLNDTHLFKLYNEAASNKELLRLLYSEAI